VWHVSAKPQCGERTGIGVNTSDDTRRSGTGQCGISENVCPPRRISRRSLTSVKHSNRRGPHYCCHSLLEEAGLNLRMYESGMLRERQDEPTSIRPHIWHWLARRTDCPSICEWFGASEHLQGGGKCSRNFLACRPCGSPKNIAFPVRCIRP
jgi:hypothetical protein